MMFKKFLFTLAITLGLLQLMPAPIAAQSTQETICENLPPSEKARCESTNENFLGTMISRVVKPLLFLVGAGAVVMIIVGGLKMVLSGGGQDAVQSAKSTITYAVIGLAVALLAYALVDYLLDEILTK